MYHHSAPVFMHDTENGSTFLKPPFDLEGVPFKVRKSRAFKDMCAGVKEAEQIGACCYIEDSITHDWTELLESFKKRKDSRDVPGTFGKMSKAKMARSSRMSSALKSRRKASWDTSPTCSSKWKASGNSREAASAEAQTIHPPAVQFVNTLERMGAAVSSRASRLPLLICDVGPASS